jgi:hypothetical protein
MAGSSYVNDICLLHHIFSHAGALIPQVWLSEKVSLLKPFFLPFVKIRMVPNAIGSKFQAVGLK